MYTVPLQPPAVVLSKGWCDAFIAVNVAQRLPASLTSLTSMKDYVISGPLPSLEAVFKQIYDVGVGGWRLSK